MFPDSIGGRRTLSNSLPGPAFSLQSIDTCLLLLYIFLKCFPIIFYPLDNPTPGIMRRDVVNRDYIARINRVLDFLRGHLDEKLSVKDLADIAAFSPSHFHFIFKKVTGESVTEYVNRLRLEKAAKMLLHNPLVSVTDVSLECGFPSLAHFWQY